MCSWEIWKIIPKLSSNEPPHDKTNKMTVRPAKTQINLGICPIWSEPSLCTQWVGKDPSFLHVDGWSESSLGTYAILLVLSWGSSKTHLVCMLIASVKLETLAVRFRIFDIMFVPSNVLYIKERSQNVFMIIIWSNEPYHKITCLRGLRPGKTQPCLLSYRD